MRKTLFISLIVIVIAAVAFTNPPQTLVGRWQLKLPTGMLVGALFRSDSTYDGFANGKSFVTGRYYVRQDTFAMSDAGCNQNYYGTYRLQFITNDSVRFTVIQDTCGGRRRGSDGLTLGRVRRP